MDERQVEEAVGNLVGVVSALEMQVQTLLLAATKIGISPKDVRRAIEAIPVPLVPSMGRDAYYGTMAGFMRCLEQAEAQLETDPIQVRKGWLERLIGAVRLK